GKEASRLQRERTAYASMSANAIRAAIARVEGDDARAISLFESTAKALDAQKDKLRLALTNRLIGKLRGGTEGQAMVHEADGWMRGEGIIRPERISRIYCAGLEPA